MEHDTFLTFLVLVFSLYQSTFSVVYLNLARSVNGEGSEVWMDVNHVATGVGRNNYVW